MTALFVGHTAAGALLGVSPWIIPVIAGAAKDARDRLRGVVGGSGQTGQSRDAASARSERGAGRPVVMDERLRARVAAMIWPE